ncbi:MAG TPA: S8 family serine peptidase [Candidatus Cybelea sp.]|jgi:subtilase family serine protease|nr:S8 family serine peptidase [Candidatus Cybelea sp.]
MKEPVKLLAPLVAVLALAACNAGGSSTVPGAPGEAASARSATPEWQTKGLAKPACPQVTGRPTCLALIESKSGISPSVSGWAPSDFQTRYNLPSSTNGSGQIVAIVDAYDNPNVATDLAAYRTQFGLGTANFAKYNQQGQMKNYPRGSTGWGIEIDLDVQMVSAACPLCTIYLVEANSSDNSDLQTAEAEAVTLGAHIVSNSWICYGSYDCVDTKDFSKPGVLYTAGTGDEGYDNIGAPAALTSVVSVGGTVLSKNGSTYNESVWDGAGAGCATGVTKPAWQKDPSCTSRTEGDVSAIAWQVAEYDTYGYGGWFTVGGTSVATPMIAAVFALAENAGAQDAGKKIWSLKKRKRGHELHYVSTGSDGSCSTYLCQAGTKQFHTYSGPAGWGTPNGVKAF